MREIKFRAWDKQHKKYYEPTFAAYKGDLDDMMVSFRGDLMKHTLNQENGSLMIHESMFPDRYILEQYTGLKDKNGKEIYEGDKVRCCYEDDETEYDDHTVIWCGEDYPAFDLKPAVDIDSNGLCYYKAIGTIEIIGNIHE